jgi:tripartite-type tricarboxylate transporter receptor subunit TctC
MNRGLACFALVVGMVAQTAHAQTASWPARPVRMIVPFTPGGTTDRIARLYAAHLSKELGQQFIVDNRAGASGTIGSEMIARAQPDGYTLGIVPSSFAINAVLYKLPYHPVTGIAPVGMIVTGPLILTMNPSVPAAGLKEFIALARAKPGYLRYGSTGAGTNLHLAGALFEQMGGLRMLHVPYKGQGPAVLDLTAGEIHLMFSGAGTMMPHIKAGKLRGIAQTMEKRSPLLPDLPAIAEFFPGYSADFWTAVLAPRGTPREIVARLNREIGDFLGGDMRARLMADGIQPAHTSPEELARIIEREIATWGKVVKAANIKAGDS